MSQGDVILFWIIIGAGVGGGLTFFVTFAIGFVGDVFHGWTEGRNLYRIVTETRHKRRLELLDKMIALEKARSACLVQVDGHAEKPPAPEETDPLVKPLVQADDEN
jgi:hypothetical protein